MNRIRCLPTLSVWQAHRIALSHGLRVISQGGRVCLVPRKQACGIFALPARRAALCAPTGPFLPGAA